MKFIWNERIAFWKMTGIIGENADWFFGFSRQLTLEESDELEAELDEATNDMWEKLNSDLEDEVGIDTETKLKMKSRKK